MKVLRLANATDRLGLATRSHSHCEALLGIAADNTLVGILTRSDVLRIQSEATSGQRLTVRDACTTDIVRAYPDETVREGVRWMLYYDIGRLPIVSRQDDRQLVGYMDRAAVIAAHRRGMHEEGIPLTGSEPTDR